MLILKASQNQSSLLKKIRIDLTLMVTNYESCGFAYKVVCIDNKHTKPCVFYRGKYCVEQSIMRLKREQKYINKIMHKIEPMIMTENDKVNFDKARICHIYEKPLKGDKVRDHGHISGKYRGAAHENCNLNYRCPKTIPVVFHNLRGYDSHLIMQHIGKFDDKITCISFSLGKLAFTDSLQFMNSSLGGL